MYSSTLVTPRASALVTFELRGETLAEVNDVLVVRRPPGYSMCGCPWL